MKPVKVSVFALHGFAQTPTQWLELLPNAACPWISGHGPGRSGVTDFDAEVARLSNMASNLPSPRVLLGYSQGARLALGMLAHTPDLFERAVLIGVHPGLESDTAREERCEWEEQVRRTLEGEGLTAFWAYWDALPVLAKLRIDPSSASEQARRTELDAGGLAWAITTLGLGIMPNFWPVLPNVSTEMHFVVGERDSKFLAIAERAHRACRRSHLHLIHGAGHDPLFDAPLATQTLVKELITL